MKKEKLKFNVSFIDVEDGEDVTKFSLVFLAYDETHAGRMAFRYLSEVYDECDKIVIKEL